MFLCIDWVFDDQPLPANNILGVQDEVLEGMQQKLDDLLVEMNCLQQQYVKCDSYISTEREKDEIAGSKKIGHEEESRCCVCVRPDAASTPQKTKVKPVYITYSYLKRVRGYCLTEEYAPTVQDLCRMDDARSDVVGRSSLSFVDHEERRMSDLSDFCWSVASSVDNHINGDNQVDKHALSVAKVSFFLCVKFCFQSFIVRIYLIVHVTILGKKCIFHPSNITKV